MTQSYSNPDRENDPHALPDIEVWREDGANSVMFREPLEAGWYWWSCFPGCLPDGEPVGPFATYDEALADAQDGAE